MKEPVSESSQACLGIKTNIAFLSPYYQAVEADIN